MIAFEGGESTSDSDDDNRTPAQKSSSVSLCKWPVGRHGQSCDTSVY
eukprot:COSAG02_NODE_2764_length_8071_cov_2.367536_4_plen_47_part_00